MDNYKRDKLSPGMQRALGVIEKADLIARHALENAPEHDPRLVAYRQLLELNREALETAEAMEYQARETRLKALAAVEEVKVRIEILEQDLGIPGKGEDFYTEDDYEEHA